MPSEGKSITSRARVAIALIAALALGSCSDGPTKPVEVTTWTLNTVRGATLPALVRDDAVMRVVLLSDTIWVREDGTGTRKTAEEWYMPGTTTNPVQMGGYPIDFTWTLTEGMLRMTYFCGPSMRCVGGPHVVGVIDDIVLDVGLDLERWAPSRFYRLD